MRNPYLLPVKQTINLSIKEATGALPNLEKQLSEILDKNESPKPPTPNPLQNSISQMEEKNKLKLAES